MAKKEIFLTERPDVTVEHELHRGSHRVTVRRERSILYRTASGDKDHAMLLARYYCASVGVKFAPPA
jgi:hypothetical protein